MNHRHAHHQQKTPKWSYPTYAALRKLICGNNNAREQPRRPDPSVPGDTGHLGDLIFGARADRELEALYARMPHGPTSDAHFDAIGEVALRSGDYCQQFYGEVINDFNNAE